MTPERVFYLMSSNYAGNAHAPYLVASLRSLRRHWFGEVVVYSYPSCYENIQRICKDESLGAECRKWVPVYEGKNGQFLNKIKLAQSMKGECEKVLYLDADTLIQGDISPLFELDESESLYLTQFNRWTCQQGSIQNRIKRLLGNKYISQTWVECALKSKAASVNGGVWCARPSSKALETWFNWTMAAKGIFIADETVLHVVQFCHAGEVGVALGGQWNCSPKHKPRELQDKDVRIWHFHGDSNVRPENKSKKGFDIWWPEFKDCLTLNVGGMAEWLPGCGNGYIKELMEKGL